MKWSIWYIGWNSEVRRDQIFLVIYSELRNSVLQDSRQLEGPTRNHSKCKNQISMWESPECVLQRLFAYEQTAEIVYNVLVITTCFLHRLKQSPLRKHRLRDLSSFVCFLCRTECYIVEVFRISSSRPFLQSPSRVTVNLSIFTFHDL